MTKETLLQKLWLGRRELNLELKARVSDMQETRAAAVALAGPSAEVLEQSDTYFRVQSGRLKLREFADGSAELIAYDRPNQPGDRISDYVRVSTSDPENLRAALGRSLGIRAVVTKRRELHIFEGSRIHLDDVDGLGAFLEFEVIFAEGESEASAQRRLAGLREHFAVVEADTVAESYIDLVEATNA